MIPIATTIRRRNLTSRHDVRLALDAGFDVDEILWMLDLVVSSPKPGRLRQIAIGPMRDDSLAAALAHARSPR